jgi:ADP-dependent NAD(P)H-hydrate dehydratase
MSRLVEVVTPALLRAWPLPAPGTSKHSRGKLLVVGGARATPGAVVLAGVGALRVGAGVITLALAESAAVQVAVAVPEAGVIALPETDRGSVQGNAAQCLVDALTGADALLVGPGLDDVDETARLLTGLSAHVASDLPVLLDAFALGALARGPVSDWNTRQIVLTPNLTEASLLLGIEADELDDASEAAAEIARTYGATVSCYGSIAAPEGQLWSVPTGHAGLGTSGSGDVLAGVLAGLLARGASPPQAACWATYLHATAGDRLASRVGRLGFLARELLDELPLIVTEVEA